MNWKMLSTVALVAAIVLSGYVLMPAVICVQGVVAGANINSGDGQQARFGSDERAEAARSDLARVGSETGFIGRLVGSVTACFEAKSPANAPLWALLGAAGGFVAFGLFTAVGRASYRRQVRRASRKGTAAFETVSTKRGRADTASNAHRATVESGMHRAPQRSTSTASVAAASASAVPAVDALDVLSALDRESAQGEWRREDSVTARGRNSTVDSANPFESVPVGGLHKPASARAPTVEATVVPAPPASGQGRGSSAAPESSAAPSTGAIGALGAAAPLVAPPIPPPVAPDTIRQDAMWENWDEDSELRDLLSGKSAEPAAPALRIGSGGHADVAISLLHLPSRWQLGEDLAIALALTRSGQAVLDRVQIRVSIIDEKAGVVDLWPSAVRLGELLDVDSIASTGRGRVVVPWAAIAAGLAGRADRIRGECTIRVACEIDAIESVASTAVTDVIAAQLVDGAGNPARPTVVRLTSASGRVVRAGVGARQAGMLDSGWLPPGRYTLEMEDGTELLTRGGATSARVALETDGLARLSGQLPSGSMRRVPVLVPDVVFVDGEAGEGGDGSRISPYGTLTEALGRSAARDHNAPPLEIRVRPCGSRTADRESVLPGPDGHNWMAWWQGRAYSTAVAWTHNYSSEEHRRQIRIAPPALREDVRLAGMQRIRIVNGAYAALREQAVTDAKLLAHLDEAYAGEPMAVILPGDQPREPYRFEIQGCVDVRIEGLRIVGAVGQSGMSIVDSALVRVIRCWIEGFESGPGGRHGVHAVGRALQIGHSGSDTDPIELTWCDLGWNRVSRQSVPVRGAAMSVYESRVLMSRCYLHDNRGNQAPPDILIDRESRLLGDATNHRAGNVVES